jgi:predicted MFS family arabinose efflux permease
MNNYDVLVVGGGAAGLSAALVPGLARRAQMSNERVVPLDRAVIRFGSVLGPFLAGLLIAWIGAANVLFVDAGTFTISALVVALGVPRPWTPASNSRSLAAADSAISPNSPTD